MLHGYFAIQDELLRTPEVKSLIQYLMAGMSRARIEKYTFNIYVPKETALLDAWTTWDIEFDLPMRRTWHFEFLRTELTTFRFQIRDILSSLDVVNNIIQSHFRIDVPSHGCRRDIVLTGRDVPRHPKIDPFEDVLSRYIFDYSDFSTVKHDNESRIISEMIAISNSPEFEKKKKDAINSSAKETLRNLLISYRNISPVLLQEAVSEAMVAGIMIS